MGEISLHLIEIRKFSKMPMSCMERTFLRHPRHFLHRLAPPNQNHQLLPLLPPLLHYHHCYLLSMVDLSYLVGFTGSLIGASFVP